MKMVNRTGRYPLRLERVDHSRLPQIIGRDSETEIGKATLSDAPGLRFTTTPLQVAYGTFLEAMLGNVGESSLPVIARFVEICELPRYIHHSAIRQTTRTLIKRRTQRL
jgi:hypothetical protein